MKKGLLIFVGIVGGVVVLFGLLFGLVSISSKKMVCKSDEGDITIMYNDSQITGYTAVGISYNLEEQKILAERIGVEAYLNDFSKWFKNNTSGTCTREKKTS